MVDIDFDKLVTVDEYATTISEDYEVFQNMLKEAVEEITFYDWCLDVVESYVGLFFAGIIGVFMFKINPSRDDVDKLIWVVVGDVSPTYIAAEDCPNAACALDSYIGAMQEWVDAASTGRSISELVPVNISATKENAEKLRVRLTMLDENILSHYEEDLI